MVRAIVEAPTGKLSVETIFDNTKPSGSQWKTSHQLDALRRKMATVLLYCFRFLKTAVSAECGFTKVLYRQEEDNGEPFTKV